MKAFCITNRQAGMRLDKWLKKRFARAPQGFVYKMLRKKNILLNQRKAAGSEVLAEGDVITCFLSEEILAKFTAEEPSDAFTAQAVKAPVPEVLYEDEDLLFFSKPAGLLSQRAKAGEFSANELLTAYLLQTGALQKEELAAFSPAVCNRLDRNTSGILAAGKTIRGLQFLTEAFREKKAEKRYHVIVCGSVQTPCAETAYLKKDARTNRSTVKKAYFPGAVPIETAYRPLAATAAASLLEVTLKTGKPHQIRAWLYAKRLPVFGDPKYRTKSSEEAAKRLSVNRQMLHAYRLAFPAASGAFAYMRNREIVSPYPRDFAGLLQQLGLSKE